MKSIQNSSNDVNIMINYVFSDTVNINTLRELHAMLNSTPTLILSGNPKTNSLVKVSQLKKNHETAYYIKNIHYNII